MPLATCIMMMKAVPLNNILSRAWHYKLII